MDEAPTVSTHVLDAEHGRPASGLTVSLWRVAPGGEQPAGSALTDADGRVRRLLDGPLEAGDYRIEFALSGSFFSSASISFRVDDVTRSYHIPLLWSPFSLTTYRGS